MRLSRRRAARRDLHGGVDRRPLRMRAAIERRDRLLGQSSARRNAPAGAIHQDRHWGNGKLRDRRRPEDPVLGRRRRWHPPPGEFMDVAVGTPSQLAVGADGTLVEWGRRESRRTGDATQVAANDCQACVLNRGGAVECRDEKGNTSRASRRTADLLRAPVRGRLRTATERHRGVSRRGRPTARNRAGATRQIASTQSRVCAVSADGHLTCWGTPWPGPLVRKAPHQRIDALTRPRANKVSGRCGGVITIAPTERIAGSIRSAPPSRSGVNPTIG